MHALYNLMISEIVNSIFTEFENLGHNSRRYTNFNFKNFRREVLKIPRMN